MHISSLNKMGAHKSFNLWIDLDKCADFFCGKWRQLVGLSCAHNLIAVKPKSTFYLTELTKILYVPMYLENWHQQLEYFSWFDRQMVGTAGSFVWRDTIQDVLEFHKTEYKIRQMEKRFSAYLTILRFNATSWQFNQSIWSFAVTID